MKKIEKNETFHSAYKKLRANQTDRSWARKGAANNVFDPVPETMFLRGPTWTIGDYTPSKQVSKQASK